MIVRTIIRCLMIAALLVGCGPTPHAQMNLDPELAQEIESLTVISAIRQDRIVVLHKDSSIYGFFFGRLGMEIDRSLTEQRRTEADGVMRELRSVSEDADFRELFWSGIESTLDASVWPTEYELVPSNLRTDSPLIAEAVKSSNSDAVLVIESVYVLTPSAEVLVVNSRAGLYRGKPGNPEYLASLTYASEAVDAPGKVAAVEAWAANEGQLLKDELTASVVETMRMLEYDLIDRGHDETGTGERVSFNFEDPTADSEKVYVKATVLDTRAGRAFLRGEGGGLFSMPEPWLKFVDRN